MKLWDNPETQRSVQDELRNWARWANDDWLNHYLMPKGSAAFRDYRPDAGEIFDPQPTKIPIDYRDATETERIIILMGLVHFDAQQALIHRYPHRHGWEEIQQIKGWPPAKAKRLVSEGEQLYYDMKLKR